jgi:hypothetical protein
MILSQKEIDNPRSKVVNYGSFTDGRGFFLAGYLLSSVTPAQSTITEHQMLCSGRGAALGAPMDDTTGNAGNTGRTAWISN